jgi:osmotically-inducible protein OsmY
MRILIAVLLLAPMAHAFDTVCYTSSMQGDADNIAMQNIDTRLSRDPITRDGGIIVVAVQNGVAIMSGKVRTAKVKQRAEKLVSRVKGVCKVDNRITVGGPPY